MPETVTLPLPSDATMAALLALATGLEIVLHPTTGEVRVVLEPGLACVVEGEHLDALFARGWIEADDDAMTLTTTDRGAYWLARWIKKQPRKGR